MKYLLDTCVISDFSKGEENTTHHILDASPSDIAISSITLFEVHCGFFKNPVRAKQINRAIQGILDSITILSFGEEEAYRGGQLRAELDKQGTPIGSYDLLIAGTALVYGLIVVTANEREFSRVKDLKIENWRLKPRLEDK